MLNKAALFFLLLFAVATVKAQTTDSLTTKLGDFDLARFNDNPLGAVQIGEKILPDTAQLSPKARISFLDHLAKAYIDNEQDKKALELYQKVAAAQPNYFVAQRALGYLYNEDSKDIQLKLYITPKTDPAYNNLFAEYKKAVLKSLPYLEKAQACDPDDDTLDLIRTLYQNIHESDQIASLPTRLSSLGKNCIDILDEH